MEKDYKVSTLLYFFNEDDEVLLLHRAQEPNMGLWSPCGGKLDMTMGESPHACAVREATEEIGLVLGSGELHLTGIVSEQGKCGGGHWLMFLFESSRRLRQLPAPIREGDWGFFTPAALADLALPRTDREMIWPLFWKHRGGFFVVHCEVGMSGALCWRVEESRPGQERRTA